MACLAIWIFHINVCLNAVVSTLQAKECMLFAGTAVASGSGIAVVTSIGMETEIGKIQSQIAAASEEEESTPLKQKLDEFGELLAKVTGAYLMQMMYSSSIYTVHTTTDHVIATRAIL